MDTERSLNLRAAALSVLILVVLLGIWHVATGPAGGATAGAEADEYAKLMGKAAGTAKTDGLPTLPQMAETAARHLASPFYDNGPNDSRATDPLYGIATARPAETTKSGSTVSSDAGARTLTR